MNPDCSKSISDKIECFLIHDHREYKGGPFFPPAVMIPLLFFALVVIIDLIRNGK